MFFRIFGAVSNKPGQQHNGRDASQKPKEFPL